MNFKTNRQYLIFSLVISVTTSLVIALVLFFAMNSVDNQNKQKERLEILQKFLQFQSSAEALINENTSLLKGYMTYIEINSNISEEEANIYLERLISNRRTLIRNIGIIEDTRIIWNYPKEGNEKAIGVDLTTVPSQRSDILKVKNTLNPLFVGPVELVQGGTGFIARFPLMKKEQYWGQISIVLDGDKYLAQLEKEAEELELNIAIFNEEHFPLMPFYGDIEILDRNGLVLDLEILNKNWKIAVEPYDGWEKSSIQFKGLKVITILFSLIIGYLLFTLMNTKNKLNHQVMNDYLTGLHNRNYLEYYYQVLSKKEEINNDLIGVFLLDINHFKKINDNYGHKIGDMVLIEFANRLQSVVVREKKAFRLGGDEFLVIVSGQKDLKDMKYIEQKIRAEVVFRFIYEDIDIEIKPSLGFAAYPDNGQTIDEIMHIADSRMYEEKRITKKQYTEEEYDEED